MDDIWINIEDDIEIMNYVVDTKLYTIDNQDQDYVFCIHNEIEDDNAFLIVTEEGKSYIRMEIMYCLEKFSHT